MAQGRQINKLAGLCILPGWKLPTLRWQIFTPETSLSRDCLWTVRTALFDGYDFNLPRLVGVPAEEAERFARDILGELKEKGIVFYYPYFAAEKSGTLFVGKNIAIVEAVSGDLWKLVTQGHRDAFVQFNMQEYSVQKVEPPGFFAPAEIEKLFLYACRVKGKARGHLVTGKSVLLEWSTEKKNNFVFYELRIF